ncbi:MAG: hypothetical protein G8237_06405 [Magnetococcales bacterium]|nr:hypothetical protein [Magnetococcales bacterium]
MRIGRPFVSGWLILGLAALALSSLLAFFLVLCRLPGVKLCGGGGFATLLVYHVDFAVLVWFLAMAGTFLSVTGPVGRWQWLALPLVWGGALALLLAPLQEQPMPVLTNYFPVLATPIFLGGMGAMGVGALILVVERLRYGATSPGVIVAALAIVCALLAFVVSGVRLSPVSLRDPATLESLFWGGGHLLQHAHVLLLASVWIWLRQETDPAFAPARWIHGWFGLALLPSVAGLFLVAGEPHDLTTLMRWGSWWVVPGVGWLLLLAWRARGVGEEPWIWLSLLLLLVGLAVGTVVREATVLVPAHYHGAVGAVTLGYMGLAHRLLGPQDDTHKPGWLPYLFAGGVLLLVAGLTFAGYSGLPRKTPGMDHPWEGETRLAIVLAVSGGVLSAVGSLLFALRALRLWWRQRTSLGHGGLLGLTLLAIAAVAAAIEIWPSGQKVVTTPVQTELHRRFEQGVVMLHAKQYEHAVTAFHWVLKQAPNMPEAHVNMGYAMLGLGKAKAAGDFFQGAIALRPFQANAYYGLAQSLEAQGELHAALGAMRSFIHLTRSEDPFLPKARAALWEWESRLRTPDPKP